MKRCVLPVVAALILGGLAACEEELPTAVRDDLVPVEPRTILVELPWATFAEDVDVFGGFGSAADVVRPIAAREYEGSLDARILVRFDTFPRSGLVRVDDDLLRPDSMLTPVGGRAIIRFDTVFMTTDEPVELTAHALEAEWHPLSANWQTAVDTLARKVPWPEPGGGPARFLQSVVWDPAESDSVVIEVDSATATAWRDTAVVNAGLRLDVETLGARVQMQSVRFQMDARPSLDPDTIVQVSSITERTTFIYTPVPQPGEDAIWVGGVPSWRAVFRWDMPVTLDGPERLCELVGCPFSLEPDRINHASLVLTTEEQVPAFRPTDTLNLDIRPVLVPDRLPKSPLDVSLVVSRGNPLGLSVAPTGFAGEPEQVSLPVTGFVRAQVRGQLDDSAGDVPSVLAFLSLFEPSELGFASFVEPGRPGEPFLRLILTTADTVDLP